MLTTDLRLRLALCPAIKGCITLRATRVSWGGGDWFNRRAVAKLNVCGGFFVLFFVAYGHIDHQEASLPFWLCDTA